MDPESYHGDDEHQDTRSQTRKSNEIRDFLLASRVQSFMELCTLREMGWQSEQAERHFNRQRTTADTSSTNRKAQQGFYKKQLEIATELDRRTGVFTALGPSRRYRILDLCLAPGAFSTYALSRSQWCEVDGITLPVASGGHEVLIPANRRGNLLTTYTDITLHGSLLPAGRRMPSSYPDIQDFANNPPLPPLPYAAYDLVICDGQRLRTHEHGERRSWEPGRLLVSQLVFALQHVRSGGTVLVLLHRVEMWNTVSVIYRFAGFSNVELVKPAAAHATRSSFYIVARNVRPTERPALEWKERLKDCWYRMTFEGPEGRGIPLDTAEDLEAKEVLQRFGSTLVRLGESIWSGQRDALRASKWIRSGERS